MSNGSDHRSGKPPGTPGGLPRIAPAVPAPVGPPRQPLPQVSAAPVVPPPVRPAAPQITAAPVAHRAAPPPRPAMPTISPAQAVAPGQPAARPPSGAVPAVSRAGAPAAPQGARPPVGPPRIAPPVLTPMAAPRPAAPPPVASRGSGILVPPGPPAAARAPAAPAPGATGRRSPLPETGAIDALTPQMAAGLAQLVKALEGMDYFQALGVAHGASPGEIKKAFYKESRTYHPDRFFHLPESETREHIGSIYKRLTEAYFVLRDDAKRKKYLADVTGPERQARLRYTEATEAELKAEARKTQEDELSSSPKARPLFKQALADVDAKNWAAAERNLKTGLIYDPGNKRFKELLVDVQQKAEEHRKATSTGYAIK